MLGARHALLRALAAPLAAAAAAGLADPRLAGAAPAVSLDGTWAAAAARCVSPTTRTAPSEAG
jgi:hypothetical protein